jgi:hypothetical protein
MLALLCAVTGDAASSYVQSNSTRAASPVALAFGSNNAAAGLIVFCATNESSNTHTFSTPTDTRGNTYYGINTVGSALGMLSVMYYAWNVGAGPNTVTVSATAGDTMDVFVSEYSGAVSMTYPLNQTGNLLQNANNISIGPVMTTVANELIVSLSVTNGSRTAGPGFTMRQVQVWNIYVVLEDNSGNLTGGPGSYSATYGNNSGVFGGIMATFEPPAAAGSIPVRILN